MKPLTLEWLTLSQAAKVLGVHPTTLRRWADQGTVPVQVTPGGHRRFLKAALMSRLHLEEQTQTPSDSITGRAWADLALIETRQRLISRPEPAWLAAFDPQHRDEKRELGRRLMSLLMQHLAAPDDDSQLLIEARSVAARYAYNCVEANLSAAEGLEATTFFRDTMTEVALRMPHVAELAPDAQLRLLRKLNQVFNTVQVSFVEYYEQITAARTATERA